MGPGETVGGLAYLGPSIDHWANLDLLMREHGRDLVAISNHGQWSRRSGSGKLARMARIKAQFLGTSDGAYLAYALRAIDEGDVRCVLAYWGTGPLPDIRALKRLRPKVKFILNVLCHPLGLTAGTIRLQNLAMARGMDTLDGLIVSCSEMQRYLWERVRGARKVPCTILPPYWSASYGPTIELPPTRPAANIFFMGRMDWKAGQPSDNVTADLRQLMGEGVDVHFGRSPESTFSDPHAHPFEALPVIDLANFAAPFDASLILYNMADVAVPDRFENTVPDRLISSVAARLPIALPSKGFSGCREYLRGYDAVLTYDSIAHLAAQLRDRARVDALRRQARETVGSFTAESTFAELMRFVNQVQPEIPAFTP